MQPVDLDAVLAQLRSSLEENDFARAIHLLEDLYSPDQAEVISELDAGEQVELLTRLDPADTADILEQMEDEDAAEIITAMTADTVAAIFNEMQNDEIADLLGEVTPDQREELLTMTDELNEIRPLMAYDEYSAGGIMNSVIFALNRFMTVQEAIMATRQWQPDSETFFYLYIVEPHGELAGVVNLRRLITADPATPLNEIMEDDAISVSVHTLQEECARIMARYDLLALPVVDENGKFVGIITVDDVIDVLEEEVTEDIQRMGGTEPLNRPYLDTTIWQIARKRVVWLLLLFFGGSLTGTVMKWFEADLAQTVALTFFIPLLIGTGGNAGSQTTSTIIRALAVGDIGLGDGLASLWRELQAGLLLGLIMGAVGLLRAEISGSSHQVALSVSVALFSIVVWANMCGAILPLVIARLKLDPTVVSGPVMATLVDATGLFIYFSIAGFFIGR